MLYRVTWEIDVEADTPLEAAQGAQRYQQTDRPEYECGVFLVVASDGSKTAVDIDFDGSEVAP